MNKPYIPIDFDQMEAELERRTKHPTLGEWFCYHIWHPVRRFIADIRYWPKYLKWRWQRMTRGYSDRDTWCLCMYLSKIIVGSVQQMKEQGRSYPASFYELGDEAAVAAWHKVLDEIIWTYETSVKILSQDLIMPENDAAREELKKWKRCPPVMTKEECTRYEQGIQFFVKYFFDLWD